MKTDDSNFYTVNAARRHREIWRIHKMNLNGKQIISILMAVLGVITISSAQLVPIIGANETNLVVSLAGLGNTILAAIMSNLTSQSNQIADVKSIASDPANMQSQSAKVALVTATDSLPEVMGVPTTNTPAGHALANAVPSNTVQVVSK
jgi:hypothetical protein